MRVLLVTGKGGVGKTTVSAATGLVAAAGGARTLLVSTDAAHSLADVLQLDLGPEPHPIAPGLDAMHLDGRHELQRTWGSIVGYIERLLGWSDLDRLRVEELMVVPGLEELVALARLRALVDGGPWDAVVVDCAPSADSLRLLTLPDVLRFYLDRVLPRTGTVGAWMRRRLADSLDVPPPDDRVVGAVNDLVDELGRLRVLLATATTTARIVVTPERVVAAEALRTLTYLGMYEYVTDAVIINRVLADGMTGPLAAWSAEQRVQLDLIADWFAPLPALRAGHRFGEPLGVDALTAMGEEIYAGVDPLAVLADHPAVQVVSRDGVPVMRLFAPAITRSIAVEGHHIEARDDGATVSLSINGYTRPITVPDALRGRPLARLGVQSPYLELVFERAPRD